MKMTEKGAGEDAIPCNCRFKQKIVTDTTTNINIKYMIGECRKHILTVALEYKSIIKM